MQQPFLLWKCQIISIFLQFSIFMVMKGFIGFVLLVLSVVLSTSNVYSQNMRKCKTPEMNFKLKELHPEISFYEEKSEEDRINFRNNNLKLDQIYIIPIVFHVVHNYGEENISKEQILDAVRIINEDFRKNNSDTTYIIPEFKAIAGDSKIEFRLAKLDPNGECTDGIVRVVSTTTYNAGNDAKYESPAWPRERYLNVWIVNSVEGAAGFSYYPSSVAGNWGKNIDGVIIDHQYIGSIGTGNFTRSRALTHEIGHYLNLMHPWGDSNDPGLQVNCDYDDDVLDTPNTIGTDNCSSLYKYSCGSLDNIQNFMDYSYCEHMFTVGQGDRMIEALNSSVASRNNLWQEDNLIATGTNDGFTNLCPPVVDFTQNKEYGCQGMQVNFTNLTYNTDLEQCVFNWDLPGATPSSSAERNPIVTYNTPGLHDVTLTVTNASGSDFLIKTKKVRAMDLSMGWFPAVTESFINENFPYRYYYALDWIVTEQGVANWERLPVSSASEGFCMGIDNSLNEKGDINTLITPNINISYIDSNLTLTFKIAYARKSTASKDIFQVKVSNDCGSTWSTKYFKMGSSSLVTNGGTIISGTFVPAEDEWRLVEIDLDSYLDYNNLLVMFSITSDNGNYLYLDDVNILGDGLSVSFPEKSEMGLEIFPNPISNESVIKIQSDKNIKSAFIEVYNVLGEKIVSGEFELTSNSIRLQQLGDLSKAGGVCFVVVRTDNASICKRIAIIK